jgi:single-strand selective monofunctional uracil DNA glycosylase
MACESAFNKLKKISSALAEECGALRFGSKVAAVYNPLVYAFRPHNLYLKLAGSSPKKAIFLGMNPGPWGMAQTGIPFGEIAAVRDWLGIEAAVDRPGFEHPARPIKGFACQRSEVSGRRLWGLFRKRFETPAEFFREHFVANYCPLVFIDQGGANITPDKLPAGEAAPLFEICDAALGEIIRALKPQWVVGIGGFAKKQIDRVKEQLSGGRCAINFSSIQVLHPSPANPRANAGWEDEVIKTLIKTGVWAVE